MTRDALPDVPVDPLETATRRRSHLWRLSAIELPVLRLVGSFFLSLAVWVHNVWIVPAPSRATWLTTTVVVFGWALLTWGVLAFFLKRKGRDLTVFALTGDLVVWTFAIYHAGAEASWLFFILLLRVADQTQTTFRRALAFALFATACYASMLAWIVSVDGRPIPLPVELSKLSFILLGGIYIALAARTAETRRARLTEAVRVSRELIRRLEEAHARAEEASAAKSEFVANMSHEMRTPLQAVIGMLQLTIEDETSDTAIRRLDTARRSAETLLSMIDDVLDFARIEARKLELEPVYFALRRTMAETMKSIGVIAASKKLTLSYLVQQDVPETVWGDPVRLRQILVNLIGNAVKFTHEGEIAVGVARTGNGVRFDVRDTGVGIAPAVRQRIFEPFTQGDSSLSRRYGGAGLGLSIVARLIEAMGGTVQVSSEPGGGSVFSFTIPLATDHVNAAPERRPWESALAGRSVLVIDPAERSRAAIAAVLRSRGVFASAFARASDAPRGRFACAVTADPTVDVHPRVVIASPLELHDDAVQVTRPVGERELIDAVGLALGLTSEAAELTLAPAPLAVIAARVLLVEDNEVNREVLSEMLRRLGHTVTCAADGEECLAKLAAGPFDIVFMDVQLPGIDGLEATRRFRADGGRTAIVALTAHTSRTDRDRCFAAGMNAVLTKPVDSGQLAAAIDGLVSGTVQSASAGEPEPESLRDSIAEIVGGDALLLARLRDAFDRQTPELLSGMRLALAKGDAEALARHAHKLKGSLSYFPGKGEALAREVEGAARAGELTRVAGLLPDIERAVAQLRAAF